MTQAMRRLGIMLVKEAIIELQMCSQACRISGEGSGRWAKGVRNEIAEM